jgi:hypothetical protein
MTVFQEIHGHSFTYAVIVYGMENMNQHERRTNRIANFPRLTGGRSSQNPNRLASFRSGSFLELNFVVNNTCTLSIDVLSSLLFEFAKASPRQPLESFR